MNFKKLLIVSMIAAGTKQTSPANAPDVMHTFAQPEHLLIAQHTSNVALAHTSDVDQTHTDAVQMADKADVAHNTAVVASDRAHTASKLVIPNSTEASIAASAHATAAQLHRRASHYDMATAQAYRAEANKHVNAAHAHEVASKQFLAITNPLLPVNTQPMLGQDTASRPPVADHSHFLGRTTDSRSPYPVKPMLGRDKASRPPVSDRSHFLGKTTDSRSPYPVTSTAAAPKNNISGAVYHQNSVYDITGSQGQKGKYDAASQTASLVEADGTVTQYTNVVEYKRAVTPPSVTNSSLIAFATMPTVGYTGDKRAGGLLATTTLYGEVYSKPGAISHVAVDEMMTTTAPMFEQTAYNASPITSGGATYEPLAVQSPSNQWTNSFASANTVLKG